MIDDVDALHVIAKAAEIVAVVLIELDAGRDVVEVAADHVVDADDLVSVCQERIGEVTPEAAIGGALGLVENGDRISIDSEARKVDLDVPESVLAERRAKFKAPEHKDEGWVSIYRRSAQPLSKGAALIDPR